MCAVFGGIMHEDIGLNLGSHEREQSCQADLTALVELSPTSNA